MENSQRKHDALLRKYSKLIEVAVHNLKDATMGELFAELDKIKAQMIEEADEKGISLES